MRQLRAYRNGYVHCIAVGIAVDSMPDKPWKEKPTSQDFGYNCW